jgi:DNA-binding transcriptional LysR family regulator
MDSPLDLRRLAQFVAVTDNESLTAAASHLNVTQQALSSAMHQLERTVGAALFERQGRRLTLSAAGRALRDGAPTLLAAADALTDATRQIAAQKSRPFVVGHSRDHLRRGLRDY